MNAAVAIDRTQATVLTETTRQDQFQDLLTGNSPPMRLLYGLMETAAKTSVTVLLQGETGVGKELVAKGIHRASERSKEAFITLNCAALPENLLESLLFGHKRGAFTGADRDQEGAFHAAHGGTIFLDEIGDMPMGLQAKILRVLQNGEVVPIGQQRPEIVDVRVIAATNRQLIRDVGRTFRNDLYYRLAVLIIHIPPLRAHVTDIPLLTGTFIRKYASLWSRRLPNTLGKEALEALSSYPWPGNVRELENEVARAVAISSDGALICKEQLAEHIKEVGPITPDIDSLTSFVLSGRWNLDQAIAHIERTLIARAMAESSGVLTHASESLGISRKRLSYLMAHGASRLADLSAEVSDVEWRLICDALEQTKGNKAAAAKLLGVKRTTLYAKINRYQEENPLARKLDESN